MALDDEDAELSLALLHVVDAVATSDGGYGDAVCWLSLLSVLCDRTNARTLSALKGVVDEAPTNDARAAIVRRAELVADVARLVGTLGGASRGCSGEDSDRGDGATCGCGRHGVTAAPSEVAP